MGTVNILFLLLFIMPCNLGFQNFQSLIPNGDSVQNPCDRGSIWNGVGHKTAIGGGSRNAFGRDFDANNKVWNSTLCTLDSDGDGIPNGVELGDPDCEWTPGKLPSMTASGHPGICEPWSDPQCLSNNDWFSCQAEDFQCEAINSPDVKNFTVRIPEMAVPPNETTYTCMNFEFPNDTDYHIIADTAAIGNPDIIHHIIVSGCPAYLPRSQLQYGLYTPYTCDMQGESLCGEKLGGWSVGIPGICYDEMAGFKIGKTGYKYGTIELHWNNPLLRNDSKDNSGMTWFYTPKLRPYNLGVLVTGEHSFSIPPGEVSYTVEAECTSTCSARMMNQSIYATGCLNHMHYLGKAMMSSLSSNGEERDLVVDSHYNYDNPIYHVFKTPVEIKPGDVLKTRCTFQSTSKTTTTYQGPATSDEMCYAFLHYYPREVNTSPFCLSLSGLPWCSLDSSIDYIDGCQVGELCSYACRKECKEYIREIRQNPCLQGRVGEYVMNEIRLTKTTKTPDFMLQYHSCDLEILQEDSADTCQCTTTPSTNVCNTPYTGSASSHGMPLGFILTTLTVIFRNTII